MDAGFPSLRMLPLPTILALSLVASTLPAQEAEVTEPYQYQTQRTHTLGDGRTVEHSYSQTWDGQTLQRTREFSGPNGQTFTREQSLAWDGERLPAEHPGKHLGWFKSPRQPEQATAVSPMSRRPSGFTVGSSSRSSVRTSPPGLARSQPTPGGFAPASSARMRGERSPTTATRRPDVPRGNGGMGHGRSGR